MNFKVKLPDNTNVDVEADDEQAALDKVYDDYGEEGEVITKVPTKSSKAIADNLRYTAKEIQDEYDRSNDIFPGEVITDPTQGACGNIYDVGSYIPRVVLGGIEGLAKTFYGGLDSGAGAIHRVAEGKDLNMVEQELINPINLATMLVAPGASSLTSKGLGKLAETALGKGTANVLGKLGAPGKFALYLPKSLAGTVTKEGITQGALAVPQTALENLTRSSKGGEPLDYSDMALYSAIGGGLGELGARSLQGIAKNTLQSEVKVRPSVAEKSANAPDPDWLLNVPRKFVDKEPDNIIDKVIDKTRKIINITRDDGTTTLVPYGDVAKLSDNISELANTWIDRRSNLKNNTKAAVNLQKIFENTWEEVRRNPELGHSQKVKALDMLNKEYEDALRTYHYANEPLTVKAAGANLAGLEDEGKLAVNYPKKLDVPEDLQSVSESIENIPVTPFRDVLDLRSRVGKLAKFDKYNDPTRAVIGEQLYQNLYKNINDVITKPAKYITTKSPKANELLSEYVVGHNLTGKDLEEFLLTQELLRKTTPWEVELPRTLARTDNKNIMGLPEMIGAAAGLGGGTMVGGAAGLGAGPMVGAALGGGALGLGAVKSLMRGLGPTRLAYAGGKALSKEATPSIVMQQAEKTEKPANAQMLVKGGSLGVELPKAYYTAKSVKDLK